ncbi:MAG TPA: Spy/CpxP family protein refolding chaperone [Thermoanaerobaculia bacterium]|nr:Spy/CpxP family protein refolding chaperone [Thermoanaerobaculia bacterium]
MKKWIPAVAVVTLLSMTAFAQPDEARSARRRGYQADVSALVNKLDLTPEQRQQMEEIQRTSRTEMSAYLDASHGTMDQIRAARAAKDTEKIKALQAELDSQRAAMKELRDRQDVEILSLLTPEQRTQLETLKGERAAKLKEQRKNQRD